MGVRRWVRRIRVGMLGRRMRRVDPLTGDVVVHGAFDGAGNGRSSSSRVGRPPRLWRKMDAITKGNNDDRCSEAAMKKENRRCQRALIMG